MVRKLWGGKSYKEFYKNVTFVSPPPSTKNTKPSMKHKCDGGVYAYVYMEVCVSVCACMRAFVSMAKYECVCVFLIFFFNTSFFQYWSLPVDVLVCTVGGGEHGGKTQKHQWSCTKSSALR